MANVIDFDVERIFRRLSVLEGAQIKYAGGQALKRLGFGLKQHHSLQMAGRFENPVPFTLNSPRYQADGLELTISISKDGAKGQDPARYLYPTDASGDNTAYLTRFGRALAKEGITTLFPVPFTQGFGVRRNAYGNMVPGQYQQVLAGLKRRDGSYFSIPDKRTTNLRPATRLPQGIYQRKGRSLFMLFGYLNSAPQVRQTYAFEDITRRYTTQQLPKLLGEELSKALR